MPVIDLPGDDGDNGFPLVFATMLTPDARARDDSLKLAQAKVRVAGLRSLVEEGLFEISGLEQTLLEDAEISQLHAKQSLGKSFLYGLMAGSVLRFVLDPELKPYASVSAAIRELADTRLRGTGSENFRQTAWPTYRSVAHFWLAFGGFGLHGWNHGFAELPHRAELGAMEPNELAKLDVFEGRLKACLARFDEFLALSEILRRRGESFVPHRARKPVLDGKTTWRIPDGHPALTLIPELEKRLTFEPPTALIQSIKK